MADAVHILEHDQQMQDAIVDCARAQLVSAGAAGLSMRAIAARLGVSAPALYRYVGSRRGLLDRLAVEAAEQFVSPFVRPRPASGVAEQLIALTTHARDWAHAHRAQYLLAFADSEGRIPDGVAVAERRALTGLTSVLAALPRASAEPRHAPRPHRAQALPRQGDNDVARIRAHQTWTRLHGVLVLELLGHLSELGTDPATHLEREILDVIGPRAPRPRPVARVEGATRG